MIKTSSISLSLSLSPSLPTRTSHHSWHLISFLPHTDRNARTRSPSSSVTVLQYSSTQKGPSLQLTISTPLTSYVIASPTLFHSRCQLQTPLPHSYLKSSPHNLSELPLRELIPLRLLSSQFHSTSRTPSLPITSKNQKLSQSHNSLLHNLLNTLQHTDFHPTPHSASLSLFSHRLLESSSLTSKAKQPHETKAASALQEDTQRLGLIIAADSRSLSVVLPRSPSLSRRLSNPVLSLPKQSKLAKGRLHRHCKRRRYKEAPALRAIVAPPPSPSLAGPCKTIMLFINTLFRALLCSCFSFLLASLLPLQPPFLSALYLQWSYSFDRGSLLIS